MQIIVDGLLTHYDRVGTGPCLLLLHGWADRLETFDALVKPLSERYEVIRLDLPGFGQTEAPKSVWGLDNYADFTANFLAKLDDPKLVALIGHSNGGALAIRGLAQGKLQAEKLVLLSASGVRNTQKLKRAGLKVVAKTGKVATVWLPRRTRNKLQKKLYGTVGSDMLVASHLKETFKRTVRQDVQADARTLTLPTLLVYGGSDAATPVSSVGSVLQECIHGSELVVVPGADHFVHQVETDKVVHLIEGFVS